MMRSTWILAASMVLAATSCHQGAAPAGATAGPGAASVPDARSSRDEYLDALQRRLDDLEARYQDLERRSLTAEGEARAALLAKVEVLRAKRDAAARKLAELKQASGERWQALKDDAAHDLDELAKAVDKAFTR